MSKTVAVFNNTTRLITMACRIGKLDMKNGADMRPRVRIQFVPGMNSVAKESFDHIEGIHKKVLQRYVDSGDLLVNKKEIDRATKQFKAEDSELDKRVAKALNQAEAKTSKAQKVIENNLASAEAKVEEVAGKLEEVTGELDAKDAKIAELEAKLANGANKAK